MILAISPRRAFLLGLYYRSNICYFNMNVTNNNLILRAFLIMVRQFATLFFGTYIIYNLPLTRASLKQAS